MWFWVFMFCFNLLIPITMIIGGRMMWRHTPKSINSIMGYRTSRSMKNIETWKFAHEYCGKLWWKLGWASFILSVLISISFLYLSDNIIGMMGVILITAQCILLVASIIPTEKALKKYFTKEGIRR